MSGRRLNLKPDNSGMAAGKLGLTVAASMFLLLACGGESLKPEATLADLKVWQALPAATALAASTPDQALQSYIQVLRDSPEAKVRAEALRRLADMSLRLAEQRLLSEADGTQAQLSPAQASASFTTAITYYQQLLKDYPALIDVASVHYQLAKAYDLKAERVASQAALADMAQAVTADGGHQQLSEAQFRMAEARFVERRWSDAEQLYSTVLAHGDATGFYEQALYKRGWSRFKQQHYELSLDDFFALIARLHNKSLIAVGNESSAAADVVGAKTGALADKQAQALYSDSYRVLALAFAYLDGANSIASWFNEHPRPVYEAQVYRALADLYGQQERYKDAAQTFQTYIDNNPYTVIAPQFASLIITTYERGQYPSLVLPAKEQFAKNYGKASLFERHVDAATMAALQPELKRHLRDVAQHYHALAQDSRLADDFRISARWYRQFVESFPADSETPLLHFLLAEAIYDAADLSQAGAEFDIVAYKYPRHEKSEPAGYAALLARQQLLQQASPTIGTSPSTNERESLSRAAAKQSAQAYLAHFSDDAKAANVQASLMSWQLTDNEIAPALVSASALLRMTMATPGQQKTAAIVAANAEFDLGNYVGAEQAYSFALSQTGHEPKLIAQFHEQRALAIYKQAEQLQNAGNKREAIGQFMRIAELEPQAGVRVNAQYDAAALLLSLGEWAQAIETLQAFRRDFAAHKLQAEIPAKLAYAYEQAGLFAESAREYLHMETLLYIGQNAGQVAAQDKKSANAKTKGNAAKILWQPLSNAEQARLARDYAWTAGLLLDKALAANLASAAPMRESLVQESTTTWTQYLQHYPDPYPSAQQARMRLLQLSSASSITNAGNLSSVERKWRQELVQAYKPELSSADIRYAVAESAFLLNASAHEQFRQIGLKLPLAKSLKAKREAMQSALKAYETVINYGVAEFTTAAGHRMAELYQQLAQALMESERPNGLDADALDEYNVLLEEQVLPFEDKAIALFERNLALSKDGHYNQWLALSLQALAKLNPGRYAKTEQIELVYLAAPAPALTTPDALKLTSSSATEQAKPEPMLTGVNLELFDTGSKALQAADYQTALAQFEKLSKAAPEFLPAYLNWALAARANKQLELASTVLEQARSFSAAYVNNDARFFTLQALIAREQGNMVLARSSNLRALELSPDNRIARHNLALLADFYLQDLALAKEQLEYYAALVPEDKAVQTWLADVNRRTKARANSEDKS